MEDFNHFSKGHYIYNYSQQEYPFYEKMQKIFNEDHLETLSNSSLGQVTFENDTATDFHKMYYKSPYYNEIIDIYNKFIQDCIVPLFKDKTLIVQKEPSFRIHLPNNTALGKRSDQKDDLRIGLHCDSWYNHPKEEINFILSVTGQEETNSCYIETQPDSNNFFPLKIQKGEFISFYGNKCHHYNMLNITNKTRISLDFRVIPGSIYKDSPDEAVHSKRKFTIGEYYTIFKSQ